MTSEMHLHNRKIARPPTERRWYRCPHCGQKILIYDDTTRCKGIYIPCKKCRREIEVKI